MKEKYGGVTGKLTFPKDDPQYDEADRLEVKEKGVTVSRPVGGKRCYILPLPRDGEDANRPRPLIILNEPLGEGVLEHLAGESGAAFCNGLDSFLARELTREEKKRKRQTGWPQESPDFGPVPHSGPAPSVDRPSFFSTSVDQGKPAISLPFESRQPRCSEVLLDCVDHIGRVQSCYTWINGILWMDRKCTDSKQFVIHMTKPPGRIMKIAQQQWVLCLQRRQQGLAC